MASIRRKPGSKFWYACYTDASGVQQQRSTKETNRNTAMKMALEFEAAYRGNVTLAQAHSVLSGIMKDVLGQALPSVTTETFFNEWLEIKKLPPAFGVVSNDVDSESEKSAAFGATYTRYSKTVARFLDHLGAKRACHINSVTPQDIISFQHKIAKELSASSANVELKTLRSAFSYAVNNSLRLDNPAKGAELLHDRRPKEERRRPFTRDELDKIFSAATSEWRGIILFGVYTGQRLGDIATFRWSEIDMQASSISFQTQKTGRNVVLPIAKPLMEYLRPTANLAPNAPVFPIASKKHREADDQSRVLSAEFHRLLVDAGLAEKRSKANTGRGHSTRRRTSPLTFHSLRHTATSFLKKAGVPESVVRDIIGHESPIISMQYTHVDDEQKEVAIEKMESYWEPPAVPEQAG